jgi:hypothetical protein
MQAIEILNARANAAFDSDGHIRDCGNGGGDARDCSPACVNARTREPK